MDNNAAIIFSSSRETTKTSNICLPLEPPAPCQSTCLHSNQPHHLPHYLYTLWRPSPTTCGSLLLYIRSHFYRFLHIVFVFPTFFTFMLVWIAKEKLARTHYNIDFQHICHVPASGGLVSGWSSNIHANK
jgi:hypothetical protein